MLDLRRLVDVPFPGAGVQLRAVAFDFKEKTDEALPRERLREAGDRFVWIDVEVDPAHVDAAADWLKALGLMEETLVHDALRHEATNHLARFEHYLHLVLAGCHMTEHEFTLGRTDCFIGERWLLTLHKGPAEFLERVRKDYHQDFVRFAQSPSFLVYEIWDHLTEHYVAVQKHFEDRVEILQRELIHDIDDHVFTQVSQVGAHLLYFRKILLPARTVLAELSTRRTVFISEATQPFLANMIGTIDRVLGDALVDRDILTQSLNLHMSMVSHQTNRLMNKLTVVSVIFLPLSFLAGVYGMNFEFIPELKYEWAYPTFWGLVLAIVVGLVFFLRRVRLL
jgi:magnesium transporter